MEKYENIGVIAKLVKEIMESNDNFSYGNNLDLNGSERMILAMYFLMVAEGEIGE